MSGDIEQTNGQRDKGRMFGYRFKFFKTCNKGKMHSKQGGIYLILLFAMGCNLK